MADWRFTGQEFEILWAAYGRDRLPYPLQFRPAEMDFSALKRQREAAVDALLGKYAVDLERALDILLEPDTRIESKGFDNRNPLTIYRFHGAVRGRAGATLVQLSGSAFDTGGEVIVSYCPARKVPERAVAALPKMRAGTREPLEVRRETLAADRDRPVRAPYEVSITEQLDRHFKRPRLAIGEITVFSGPAVDARQSFGRGFWWMDYEDGRYYVKTGDPIIAKPLAAQAMAAEVHRLTTLTQRYYREDLEHDEYLRQRR
ncbi:ESX secretion-associated protein EspG [Nocardia sp. KC 131]|uniref:ESX secretion-associated protein EspG n=1 Tax=Nocardia arseniciresistens TaxID=3392119 RepID=UPI00398ED420